MPQTPTPPRLNFLSPIGKQLEQLISTPSVAAAIGVSVYAEDVSRLKQELAEARQKSEDEAKLNGELRSALAEFAAATETALAEEKVKFEAEHMLRIGAEEDCARLGATVNEITSAFHELKARYEELKTINENRKKNEDTLMNSLKDAQAEAASNKSKFDSFKAEAEEKLQGYVKQVTEYKAKTEKEMAMLVAHDNLQQSQILSLKQEVANKAKENAELISICEQLMCSVEGRVPQ